MTLKSKWDHYCDSNNMYSWIFVNGVMTILNEDTYYITIKENYIHRTPYYEISINNRKDSDEANGKNNKS